ncbi:MAG: hypothetical protein JXA25_18340 [Anaerolineales bacterium]|nr:hypothetical protein [Anaerolineales bacterium]
MFRYSISGPDSNPNLFLATLLSSLNQHDGTLGHHPSLILNLTESTRGEGLITLIKDTLPEIVLMMNGNLYFLLALLTAVSFGILIGVIVETLPIRLLNQRSLILIPYLNKPVCSSPCRDLLSFPSNKAGWENQYGPASEWLKHFPVPGVPYI